MNTQEHTHGDDRFVGTPRDALTFYDRTRVTTDWTCRRRRYYATQYGGRGLAPVVRAHPLTFGSLVHALFEWAFSVHVGTIPADGGLLRTALAETLDTACDELLPPFKQDLRAHGATVERAEEQAALAEGLFRGWFASEWEEFDAQYEVLAVEVECLYEHDGCVFASKPDLVIRRRDDASVWYWEWKTTSNVKASWFAQWNYDAQFLAGALGIKATLGLDVAGVIVQGLYKGYEKADASGVKTQVSPFCYVWVREIGTVHGVDLEYSVEYQRAKGWAKRGVWEVGGVEAHIARMSRDTLKAQFPRTPPHFVDATRLRALLKQRAVREQDIADASRVIQEAEASDDADAVREILDEYFPQSFNACAPAFGSPCPYRDLCHTALGEDPLGSGLYEWRTPHHTTDPMFNNETDDAEEAA